MTLDLTLSPLYRINGQEIASLPGLLALTPPQNAARGREKDQLIVYLLLTGNSTFSTSEYLQVAQDAADIFYQTTGPLTRALRTAAELVNKTLLERNITTSGRGQYAVGWLTLAVLRDIQCTLSLSGPMHAYWFGQQETRHIHESIASGKGLGTNHTTNIHFAQTPLNAGDRLLFFGRSPSAWESMLNDPTPSSLDAMRRRLTTLTSADLNAVLMQATDGKGVLNLLNGTPEPKENKQEESAPLSASRQTLRQAQDAASSLPRRKETLSSAASPAHTLQPSAYAIPPEHLEPFGQNQSSANPLASLPRNTTPRDFPVSIPRTKTASQTLTNESVMSNSTVSEEVSLETKNVFEPVKTIQPQAPREPSARTRQTAKSIAVGIRSARRISEIIGEKFRNFLPRLLPNSDTSGLPAAPSTVTMMFMAVLIPLMVVTIASVVYLRYGRSLQYDTYLGQAQEMKAQALTLSDPVEQRIAWENVLLNVDIAESHRETSEIISLRHEAETNLDKLLGITRLQFNPAFSSNLGIEVSRMAASEFDLFLLNAANGEALRAQPATSGGGYQLDTTFNCKPGVYGNYTVGPLVDILALPNLKSINATLLGIDAGGNLLYCAPGQIAQAIPLPVPDTNWGRVTAFALENGNLYVLDAPARAVWVYNGKDGTFIDQPYFFFGGQTPEKQDAIDLVITGDNLYMLHADGHLSTCSYSRIESVPTRCEDPSPLVNPFAAYQDVNLFASAHFTQILFNAQPDQSILLLDAESQGVLRFTPRSLELQNQFRPTTGLVNPIPSGEVGAITVSPNHVLYLSVKGQVYFATDMP
ncbi:MAG TPA: hypothetical protein VFI68_04180 [Anaerolineales bacterium]|nr:hypothetical protein [Anaerolineales bacterium]